jgi:uncharacterized membrane protein
MPDLSIDRMRFLLQRLRERLWARPLAVCLLSIGMAFGAHLADGLQIEGLLPRIAGDALESLLTIQASSMMVIATFAVASMVSAYASASTAATPRAFALIVADDVSQNALSTFIGAFIFSIVALAATQNGYYGRAGLFALFVLTLLVFAVVILTFVRWVDRIARLGRMGPTIAAVERATAAAIARRRRAPHLGGAPVRPLQHQGVAIHAAHAGYVQHVDVSVLQACAEQARLRVVVAALPGTFAAPGVPLAWIQVAPGGPAVHDTAPFVNAFLIGEQRQFDDDPRFGLVVLSQIAGRALSPAVNDPGTAIDIIGALVRLFMQWAQPAAPDAAACTHDRVEVPALQVEDMFDDAFTSLARDGAPMVEVGIRLQKALRALAQLDDMPMQAAALRHARTALERARLALALPQDLEALRAACGDDVETAAPAGGADTAVRA